MQAGRLWPRVILSARLCNTSQVQVLSPRSIHLLYLGFRTDDVETATRISEEGIPLEARKALLKQGTSWL